MRRGLPLCFLLVVGCQTLARQTQWTDVVPQTGARKMQVYEIPSWGNGAPTLEIELPAGYTIESRKGADFDVHYLSRVTTDDAETGKIGIYVGHYPSLFESDQPPIEKVGRVGPKAVKWLCSDGQNGEGKHAFGCQTLVSGLFDQAGVPGDANSGVRRLMLHFFISSREAGETNVLREATKTLRFKQ